MKTILIGLAVILSDGNAARDWSGAMSRADNDRPVHALAERAAQAGKYEKATFAAGCFWHVEAAFRKVPGVVSTMVGYTGGRTHNPTYREVCTDTTGHAEAVQLIYDPAKISYEELLKVFWSIHDPTTMNRQGPDVGTQYRSVIFCHNEQQQTAAETSKQELQRSRRLRRRIVTQIVEAATFYPAEEYHQCYLEKHGINACGIPTQQ
ncbi:MAG: peptide-methionine (S)-S-oxide reductase MsrA [Phycisphaerales bacterium]|nr:MAG: peptide-methionine (S)-S-oxide reductase MsrA [Phycisphaerales bacterium]